MSPRPRSRDKVIPVSVGLPISLMMRLDNELDWNQSRSRYVKSAIIQKLEGDFDYDSISSKQLVGMLHNRGVVDYELFTLLCAQVKAAPRVEP